MTSAEVETNSNFIRTIINKDLEIGTYGGKVSTRFPPEPNGYLHIGHAKAICLSFGIARDYKGTCNLRFDDTNPAKEEIEYMDSIKSDVEWLGFKWNEPVRYASDYYEKFYLYAVALIKAGKAYVCSLSMEDIRKYRGTLTEPGRESPYRNRGVKENLELFEKMRAGVFNEGSHVLRAKIDMAAGNINMRDPAIYRIRKAHHYRTGNKWCVYPMYDFAHCLSDYLEEITHSLCTLEFQDHRPLYDWFLEQLVTHPRPQQIEFARLNLNYTVTSKRKLKELVDKQFVSGWDDPRMPTLVGLRRRGYTPSSIRQFCDSIGVAKKETTIDLSILEDTLRRDLENSSLRAMAVLKPIKLTIVNYPDDKVEVLEAPNHPKLPEMGSRKIPFSKHLLIEDDDFSENPPPKYHRLSPGKEVRLRYSYVIKCQEVIKDGKGNIKEVLCTYDPDTLGKKPEGRKVKGIIHWASSEHSIPAKVILYDRLFKSENPGQIDHEGETFLDNINPNSKETLQHCWLEPSLKNSKVGDHFQFERQGYFCVDTTSSNGKLVFNRSVTLRDGWKK